MSITYETRREALESVDMTAMEAKVYGVILEHGAVSAEQIMEKLRVSNPNNVRPRLTGLAKKGLIKATGKRVNAGGRNEAVWEIV